MSDLQNVRVTKAMRANYDLLRHMVGMSALEWIVVRTNPNCEGRALTALSDAGLLAWRPMVSKVISRRKTGKMQDISKPMFTRYLFVCLDRSAGQDSNQVRVCDGVEKILSFHDDRRPHIVKARQMRVVVDEAWKAMTDQNYVPPQAFDIGDTVRMLTDAAEGFEFDVSAYDMQKGTVSGTAKLFGGQVPVTADVDKVRKVA